MHDTREHEGLIAQEQTMADILDWDDEPGTTE